MYCRVCGAVLNEKATICVKCGCNPLNGDEYCQECGAKTTEKQEMCIKCGCMLKKIVGKSNNFLDYINNSNSNDTVKDLDFSSLPPYYQKEFQKIYTSNETYKGKFNIWGLLFGGIWALTKGCWLSVVIAFIGSLISYGIIGVIYWFIWGFRGTYMYYCAYVKDKQCII